MEEIVIVGTDDALRYIYSSVTKLTKEVGELMASIDDMRDQQAVLSGAISALKDAAEDAADRVDAKIQAFIDAQVNDADIAALANDVAAVEAIKATVDLIGSDEPPVEEPPVEEPPVEEPPVEEPPVEEPPVEEPPVEPPVEEPPVVEP